MTTTVSVQLNAASSISVGIATPGPKGDPSAGYYIAAHDELDQTNAGANQVNVVKFRSTDESDGITIEDDSKITFDAAGVYNVQFSIQVLIPSGGASTFDVWFRLNGDNVPNSNTRYYLANNSHGVAALNYVTSVQADDFIQVAWSSPSTALLLEHDTGLTTPNRPDIPSAILTVTQIQ
jgi:hypothetical protein